MSEPTSAAGAALSASAPIAKASSAAIFGGSGTAIMFGLTPGEWQVLGIIGGVLVGVAGLVVNVAFKWLHYRLAAQAAEFKPGLTD